MPDHLHVGTTTGRVSDPPFASRGTNDRVGDGQAEPSPFATLIASLEPVEKKWPLLRRDAGAAVFDGQANGVPGGRHHHVDPPPRPGVSARIVDQYAAKPVDPTWRRFDQHVVITLAAHRQRNAPGAGYGDKPLRTGVHERGEVNRLVVRSGGIGVEPGQEEQVLHDVAQAFALGADAADSGLIALAFSRRAQGQADLGLYDRERGPQFVGSVCGELELAPASLFYGP